MTTINKMKELVCVGTLAIDRYLFVKSFSSTLREGEVDNSEMKYGGGAGNTALAARKLKIDADVLAYLGNDIIGESYAQHMASQGIFGVVKKEGGTPLCTYIINPKTEQQKGYWFLGTGKYLRDLKIPEKVIKNSKVLHLAQTPAEVGLSLLKKKRKDLCLSYNPGPPIFTESFTRIKKIIVKCKYLFINETEFGYILKKGLSVEDVLDGVKDKVIVVTRGDLGSEAYTHEGRITAPCIKTKYVETNGAGDAFIAGFFKGVFEGRDIKRCLEYGNSVSSYVIEKIGCQTNQPTYTQMKKRWKEFYSKKKKK